MIQNFDIFGRHESSPLVLCNIDGEELDILHVAKEVSGSMRYTSVSDLSFTISKQVKGDDVSYYDSIQPKRIVSIEDKGRFIIESVNEEGTGLSKSKRVESKSLEYETYYRTVDYLNGTYRLYNANSPENTLLNEILKYIPRWNIGHVDTELVGKYRTFDIQEQNVYDVLMNDVAQAYECVFKFDTFNRIIHVLSPTKAIKKTDIFMTYRNLIKKIDIEENSNEMFTAMNVFGEDGLDVSSVNPIGNNKIYNFDYYKHTSWMEQELIDAINLWEAKIIRNQADYAEKFVVLKEKNMYRLKSGSDMYGLEGDKASLENIRATRIEQGIAYGDVNVEIGKIQEDINAKQTEIDNIQSQIGTISSELSAISGNCSFETNFTTGQLNKLDSFIIENTYNNEWFVVTDSMTNTQEKDIMLELYQDGKKALEKISKPTTSFNVDSINFITLQEFKEYTKQLELGCEVTIAKDEDVFVYPILLEYSFNYDSSDRFGLVFSDKLRLNNEEVVFGELFEEVSRLGSSALVAASDASKKADSARDNANSAINSAWLANGGVFETKFEILDMGKKQKALEDMSQAIDGRAIEIAEDLGILAHDITQKQIEWNKISGITDEMGKVLAGEIAGNLNSSVNNIVNSDGTVKFLGNGILSHNLPSELLSTEATLLNASGLLVSNSKIGNAWNWTTAISGDGINASSIKTGVLTAVNIDGVEITGTTITGGEIKGAKFEAMEILSGSIEALDMTAGKITGGIIEGVTINTATMNTVTLNSGTINAVNITATATITGSVITGAEINGATINGGEAHFGDDPNKVRYTFRRDNQFVMHRAKDGEKLGFGNTLAQLSEKGTLGRQGTPSSPSGALTVAILDGGNKPPSRQTTYMTNEIQNRGAPFTINGPSGINLMSDNGITLNGVNSNDTQSTMDMLLLDSLEG